LNRVRLANRVSRLYDVRSLRSYVYWKIRTDPAYPAVVERLRGHESDPLLDLGCGVGALAFFLREHGLTAPIIGIDFDERKIEAARKAALRYRDVDFMTADVRDPLPGGHNILLIDVLQYFDSSSQQQLLTNVARAVPPGGVAIIRQGIRDESWRHTVTRLVDRAGRAVRWLRAEKMNFPTRDDVARAFADEFEIEVEPLWGRTPFNNYLFVFRRSSSGTTNR
jgi:SAM-dependent methyltransferase